MSEPFLGEIFLVPYSFPPRYFAFCQGQLMAISQNTALFSLLGTNFGGDGVTTFALPDLRGRVPVGAGQGPRLSPIELGQQAGSETVTLTTSQMPVHNHLAGVSQSAGTSGRPANQVPAGGTPIYAPDSDGSTLNPGFVRNAGGSQPVAVRQPYLGLNYIIALQGIFPSRE